MEFMRVSRLFTVSADFGYSIRFSRCLIHCQTVLGNSIKSRISSLTVAFPNIGSCVINYSS